MTFFVLRCLCVVDIQEVYRNKSCKRFGKPVIIGTRISVADILNWMANGMSRQEITEDFPEVSDESINACLFYAASKENHLGIAS